MKASWPLQNTSSRCFFIAISRASPMKNAKEKEKHLCVLLLTRRRKILCLFNSIIHSLKTCAIRMNLNFAFEIPYPSESKIGCTKNCDYSDHRKYINDPDNDSRCCLLRTIIITRGFHTVPSFDFLAKNINKKIGEQTSLPPGQSLLPNLVHLFFFP